MKFLTFLVLVMILPAADFAGAPRTSALGFEFSGPYGHENLEVFLLHGADAVDAREFLTLSEALASASAELTELDDARGGAEVTRLQAKSLARLPIYVEEGDVVQGGRQDRAISHDVVLAPKAARDVAALCVEEGRWDAKSDAFATPDAKGAAVPSTGLKLAIRDKAQEEVWRQVGRCETTKSTSVVRKLVDPEVKKRLAPYVTRLAELVSKHEDARGLAFVINGKLHSIDTYESHDLLARVWPKRLAAAANEAAGTRAPKPDTADVKSVVAAMKAGKTGKAETEKVDERLSLTTYSGDSVVLRETWYDDDLIHASYLTK